MFGNNYRADATHKLQTCNVKHFYCAATRVEYMFINIRFHLCLLVPKFREEINTFM